MSNHFDYFNEHPAAHNPKPMKAAIEQFKVTEERVDLLNSLGLTSIEYFSQEVATLLDQAAKGKLTEEEIETRFMFYMETAKAMHKIQVINAYTITDPLSTEAYYNETFTNQ